MTETQKLTKTEQNQLAALVGVAVALILLMIAPASRDWIVGHATVIVTYVYDAFLVPVGQAIGTAYATVWGWLGGLLPW